MLRRLHAEQPDSFAFTPANMAWADAQISKYPEGRQASAVIPLLWRAQEQEGWLTRPAMEEVGRMLGLAYIRVLEVATFYFMFQLQPVGTVAHVQVCGTTSCMICGAEDLIGVCRDKIASKAHALSDDGRFSWEEVECLGACSNAPMVQIGKDYYEDLTTESFGTLLDRLAAGEVPVPGPQNGRFTSEPAEELTSLTDHAADRNDHNASVALAVEIGDTIKRIDGTEVPLVAPWRKTPANSDDKVPQDPDSMPPSGHEGPTPGPKPSLNTAADKSGVTVQESDEIDKGRPDEGSVHGSGDTSRAADAVAEPARLDAPRDGSGDDLQKIRGIGPKLATMLNDLGFHHFDQIAEWGPEECAWVDSNLEGFRGRVDRDGWVQQARALLSDKETKG